MRTTLKIFSLSILLTLSFFSSAFAQPGTWVVQEGGKSAEFPRVVAMDANGNAYAAGFFRDTVDFGGQTLISAGETDIFVAKYDPTGTVLWANRYGWLKNDHVSAIQLDGTGNLYLSGEFQDSTIFGLDTLYINTFSADTQGISDGLLDLYILKLNTDGVQQWVMQGGGWGSDFAHNIEIDAAGDVLVTGSFRTRFMLVDTILNKGYNDIYIAKISSAGTWLWDVGAGGVLFDEANQIELIGDTAIYIAGYFQDTCYFRDSTVYVATAGYDDIFLAKYSSNGVFRWVKRLGGPENEAIKAMTQDAAGNLYIAGYFQDTVDFWGTTLISQGNFDGFIMKVDPAGNTIWIKQLAGPQYEVIEGLAIEGNTIGLTGFFQGSATLGTGPALVSSDIFNQDAFFASMDLAGNVNWTRRGGGVSVDGGKAVSLDPNGYMVVMGEFGDSAWFGQVQLVTTGGLDVFLIRVDANGSVHIQEPGANDLLSVKVWPNPAQDHLNVQINGTEALQGNWQILDLQGKAIQTSHFQMVSGTADWTISTQELPSGMYLLQIQSQDFVATQKIIVGR